MKNKSFYIIKFFLFYFILFPSLVLSDVIKFNASEIETFESGNLIKGSGGVEVDDGLGLVITSEKFEYDKVKSTIIAKDKVLIKDNLNGNKLKSDHIVYFKGLNKIISKDKTVIELNSGQIIDSSNIIYDRNLNIISSNEKTLITDKKNNKFNLDNFNYSTIDKVLTANGVKINDYENNYYEIENISYNMNTDEILGKDISLNFNGSNMSSSENEPRLKGNAIFIKNSMKVNSGVFTTCKKTTLPSVGFELEEIRHDKTKQSATKMLYLSFTMYQCIFSKIFSSRPYCDSLVF